jgi:glycine/D-amino acid oxidase-like deaminating enzyme
MVAPGQEFRQSPDGRILAPTSAGHQGDDASTIAGDPFALAMGALDRLGSLLGTPLALDAVTLAMRPVPDGGLPAIGPCGPKGLWAAVMHSGITLGPLIGRLVADWCRSGTQPALLRPYGIGRFS